MVTGASQIGKTYLLQEFCHKKFARSVYLNFVETPSYKQFFTPSNNAAEIIDRMELFFNQRFEIENTVFFFDEIQDCQEAIASLKYFAESQQNYRIVCAGHSLGVIIHRMGSSFPVGKVQLESLFPMDFEEFLWALGETILAEEIRRHFMNCEPFPDILHEKALMLYRTYLCIGGMPANVLHFVENQKNPVGFNRQIATNILTGYLANMVKYAGGTNAVKIHDVFHSIPAQLSKGNAKFTYQAVAKGGNREKFRGAIDWLIQANMVLESKKIEMTQSPPTAYESNKSFKLYLSDVGLLTSLLQIGFHDIMYGQDWIYRSFLTENFVAQTLHTNFSKLYFWNSDNRAEIDFLLDTEKGIIPVEVKASENVRAKSLGVYKEKYRPPYTIRLSSRNYAFIDGIIWFPLYATHCV
jgi:predicted AAA+ superfamily ATPase